MAKRQLQEEEDESDLPVIISIVSGASTRCGRSNRRVNHKFENSKHQGMLNSSLFDCYLGNIWRSFPEDKTRDFLCLDCMWFSLYMDNSYKGKVLAWIKKKHIFSKKYVFIPIVHWSHWSLLIFCNFGGSSQSEPITPCMLLLDSLRMADPRRLEPLIRKFVLDIYEVDDRPEKKQPVSWIPPLLVPEVPQQKNEKDCGYFVLYFINLFVNGAPENFCITEGYPYFMREDWFGPEDFDCFCDKLKSYSS